MSSQPKTDRLTAGGDRHARRLGVWLVLVSLIAMLGACAQGGRMHRLYEEDESGRLRLKDSEIVLESQGSFRRKTRPERRELRVVDGIVRGTVETGNRQGTAEVPTDAYESLWDELISERAFTLGVEAPDTSGGLYHVVRLRLGNKTGEFSGQNKTNFLGFSSQSIKARSELVNRIARVFGEHVPTTVKPKDAPKDSRGATSVSTPGLKLKSGDETESNSTDPSDG